MRHYEIMFLVHLEQSDQTQGMISRYCDLIKSKSGIIKRVEDWGRLQLAYPIENSYKAHYVLLNVESGKEAIDELQKVFRYNDAIIRHLIVRVDEKHVDYNSPSIMRYYLEDLASYGGSMEKRAKAMDAKEGSKGGIGFGPAPVDLKAKSSFGKAQESQGAQGEVKDSDEQQVETKEEDE